MELKKITLELTEEELLTLHGGLEDSIKRQIEELSKYRTIVTLEDEIKAERDLLDSFSRYFGYKMWIWSSESFKESKSYDDVDEWIKALIENAKNTPKLVE